MHPYYVIRLDDGGDSHYFFSSISVILYTVLFFTCSFRGIEPPGVLAERWISDVFVSGTLNRRAWLSENPIKFNYRAHSRSCDDGAHCDQ